MNPHLESSKHQVKVASTKATPRADACISQELRPQLNAIVEIAEVLKMKSGDDQNVQRILNVARDLLGKVERQLAEPSHGDAVSSAKTDAQCDVLYIEDNPISFGAVHLLLENQRGLKVVQAKCGKTGVALAQSHVSQN